MDVQANILPSLWRMLVKAFDEAENERNLDHAVLRHVLDTKQEANVINVVEENWPKADVDSFSSGSSFVAENSREEVETAKDELLSQILTFLSTSGGSNALRIRLLILLQDHHLFFFSDLNRLDRMFSSLRSIIRLPKPGEEDRIPFAFRSQVLITITTIFICVDAIEKYSILFASLVDFLLCICRETDISQTRMLRASACQCLFQLESQYQGLLQRTLGHILRLCRSERTHALPAYINLMVLTLLHYIQLKSIDVETKTDEVDTSKFAESMLSLDVPLSPFGIPVCVKADLNRGREQGGWESEQLKTDTFKCVSVAIETAPQHSAQSLSRMICLVIKIVKLTSLSSPLKHHFSSLLFARDSLLCHTSVLLMVNFPDEFDVDPLLSRVCLMVNDFHSPSGNRHLALRWLAQLAADQPGHSLSKYIDRLLPVFDDSILLMESKLSLVAAHGFDSSRCVPPPDTLNLLTCLDEYHFDTPDSDSVLALLRTVFLLTYYYPNLWSPCISILRDLVFRNSDFVGNFIDVLITMERVDKLKSLANKMYENVSNALAKSSSNHLIGDYLPLLENLVDRSSLNPIPLLQSLLLFLRNKEVCDAGDWAIGTGVLRICQAAVLCHGTSKVIHGLRDVLILVGQYFDNIDIRDRAAILFHLVTHVSGDKLKTILAGPDVSTGVSIPAIADLGHGNVARPEIVMVESFLELCPIVSEAESTVQSDMAWASKLNLESLTVMVWEEYTKMLSNYSAVDTSVPLNLSLQYVHSDSNGNPPGSIYGCELLFEVHGNSCHEIDDYSVPLLSRHDLTNSWPVSLTIRPKKWSPFVISVLAEFTDPQGRICVSIVAPVVVELETMFLKPLLNPILRKLNLGSDVSSQNQECLALSLLFSKMWANILSGSDSAESVKVLSCNSGDTFNRIVNRFSSFVVPFVDEEENRQTERCHMMVFIPPSYHILFDLESRADGVLVRVLTDSWELMEHVDKVLERAGELCVKK